MNNKKEPRPYKAIGLMSGTSLDGIDIAVIDTDGQSFVHPGPNHYVPYSPETKDIIRACFGMMEVNETTIRADEEVTRLHIAAVKDFMANEEFETADIGVIGFHGQTITHQPKEGFTWQLGNGDVMAAELGIPVVSQFRIKDVEAGGEGAPLIPLYHQALARQKKIPLPAVFLNIGGVANVTFVGKNEGEILAFDTGPGNALMDDFMKTTFGQSYDFGGSKAKSRKENRGVLDAWLASSYFKRMPPKSLDRGFVARESGHVNPDVNAWDLSIIWDMAPEDAMATLAHFTVEAVIAGSQHFPQKPAAMYVCGGGRHNDFVMELLRAGLDFPVKTINDMGFNGDAIESEGFAYLAVRHLNGLPLSLPTTTGVAEPTLGGILHEA